MSARSICQAEVAHPICNLQAMALPEKDHCSDVCSLLAVAHLFLKLNRDRIQKNNISLTLIFT
jgi:hypothetical protein